MRAICRSARLAALPLIAALALSACGSEDEPAENPDGSDPALTGALADQIMVDPELAGRNAGADGLRGNGPASANLPTEERSPEAIAKAKAEAAKLVGGKLLPAPAPVAGGAVDPMTATPAEMAGNAPGLGSNCAEKAEYSAAWAARLPAALTVYPRGHVVEAAGTDRDGCRLRVVHFVTPVAPKDVVDFYHTRVKAAGYDAEHRTEGKDSVLGGSKDAAAYMVMVRKAASGLTEVDLIANGG